MCIRDRYWTDVFSGSGKTLTFAGILSGSGGISLTKNGIVIISSASTYTGNTNLEAGPFELQKSISSAEIIVSSGATLRINAENVTINKLTINSGGTVVVEAAKQLTVTGALTNNGTLNLLSTAAGTATLVAPGTITGTGTTNVSQYLKDARNWYVASPVSGATLPASGYTLFELSLIHI